MKSLVISLGGKKAARIVDLLSYYSRKLDSKLYVEVFDTEGKELHDATVKITRKYPNEGAESESGNKNGQIPYEIHVIKDGYQPVTETVMAPQSQAASVQVYLAPNRSPLLITTVFLILLSPFIWAAFRYAGLLFGLSTADYLTVAFIFFIAQIIGILSGLRLISKRMERFVRNRYFSGVIGIITGAFLATIVATLLIEYLVENHVFVSNIVGNLDFGPIDTGIFIVLIVILGSIGLVIDQLTKNKGVSRWISTSLFIAFGALLGGLISQHYTQKILDLASPGVPIGIYYPFGPFVVFAFTLIWCYLAMFLLTGKGLAQKDLPLYEGVFTILGVMLVSGLLPLVTENSAFLLPFTGSSILGALAGLIFFFVFFNRSLGVSRVGPVQPGITITKNYNLAVTPFAVDSIPSRLEGHRFIPPDHIIYCEDTANAIENPQTNLKDRMRRKINGIYRSHLEQCSRLFSACVAIIDLRDNAICDIAPDLLDFIHEEFSVPLYTIVLSTDSKINKGWLKQVLKNSDAVFPVDYNLFEDVQYLDQFVYQLDDILKTEEIYEEGCVVDLIRRLAPLLEIGERQSPSGLDVAHLNRLLSRERSTKVLCDESLENIPPSLQNVSTCGYFALNTKNCPTLNLELAMGEYIRYTLGHPLWKIQQSLSSTHAIVITRGRREYLVTELVATRLHDLYDGLVMANGNLLIESGETIEIIIVLSNIMPEIASVSEEDDGCSEKTPGTSSPGFFRTYWHSLIRPGESEVEELDERFRRGYDAYISIVQKYYNRSPMIRHRAVTLARQHPGAHDWKQAQAICEWVRDTISYVSDPLESEYIQLPEETMNLGGGDCDDQAVLLASLLMCVGFRSALVFVPRHVYVAIHIPESPGSIRTFQGKTLSDVQNLDEWVGFDPTCSNCSFGTLPEDDYMIEKFIIIGE